MKRVVLFCAAILAFHTLHAQQHYQFRTDAPQGFSIKSSNASELSLHYAITELGITDITTGTMKGQEILLKGNFGSTAEGLPNLPVENRYIAVPNSATVSIEIKENAVKTLSNIDLLPAAAPQGNTQPTLSELHKDPAVYQKDVYFPAQHAVLSEVSTIRGLDVVMLSVSPIRYNPVRKTLEVVYDMDIEIRFDGGNGTFGEDRYRNPDWDNILRNLVINREMLTDAHYYDHVNQAVRDGEEGCEYLIIAPDDESILAWADTLKVFRTRQGILTKVVTTTECGGNDPDAIRNYVLNAYEHWAIPPAAILIFGDYLYGESNSINPYLYHLISWQGYYYEYATDNPISDMNGDSIPDIALTRMTVTTPEEYQLQVEKAIHYELNPPMDPLYYDHPVITSGYQDNTWFMFTSQSANGFFSNKLGKHPTNLYMVFSQEELNPTPPEDEWSIAYNSQAVVDYFGPAGENYIPQSIGELDNWSNMLYLDPLIDAINKGSYLTLYRDHSSESTWCCPWFGNENFHLLNQQDPTFVLSIGCLCGDFTLHGFSDVYSDCFNSKFNKQPVGSIGSIGAASGTYTQHNDMITWGFLDYIYPEFMSTMGSDTEPDFVRPSYALAAAKLFLKQQTFIPYTEQPAYAERTMNIFNHLGEGYLNLYTEVPTPIVYSAFPYHYGDQSQYTFTAEAGTLVCFSKNDEILVVAQATGAPQTITLPLMEEGTRFTMTLTKQNGLRTDMEITAITSGQSYVYVSDFTLNDEDGNGQPDYGEVISIDFTLHNMGDQASNGGNITVLDDSPYYEVIQGSTSYPSLEIDGHNAIANAVTIRLADNVPDQTKVQVVLQFSEGGRTHVHPIPIIANAPVISIDPDFHYSYYGLPSSHINAEKDSQIILSVKNTGHSTSRSLQANMTLKAPFVTVKPSQRAGLEPNEQADITLTAIPKGSGITNTWLQSHAEIHYGAYVSSIDTLVQYGCIFEGFETDTPNVSIHNHSAIHWNYDDTDAFDGERCLVAKDLTNASTVSFSVSQRLNFPSKISFFYKNKTSDTLIVSYKDSNNTTIYIPLAGNDQWNYYEVPIVQNKQPFFYLSLNDDNGTGNYAKVDNICFPSRLTQVVCAGDTLISCGNSPVEINTAYAYNCKSVFWTTSGDGTFEPEDAAETTYIPGNQDVANGLATLTLHATSNTDTLTHATPLILGEIPIENIEGNASVNISLSPVSHYTVPAVNDASYNWSLIPAKAGEILANDNEVEVVWNTSEEVGFTLLSVTIENECATKTVRKGLMLSGYSIPEWDDLMPAEAYLYNILGELICTFHTTHSDIDNILIPQDIQLPSSIYILKLNTPKGSISKKIIIP